MVAIFYAFWYYTRMSTKTSNELSPIERSARNSIVWKLHTIGFSVSSIAHIMGMTQSTVSRVVDKKPKGFRVMDTILFGESFGE
jgi:predicted transcriptional regulator